MHQNTTLAGAPFASIQLPIILPDDPKTFWPLAAALVLAIYILYNRPLKGVRGNRIPKGPTGLPILGMLLPTPPHHHTSYPTNSFIQVAFYL